MRRLERRVRQTERDAQISESLSLRSKEAMLRAHQELEGTVSQLQATARELEAAKLEAEAANEAKDQFLATISHEMRTPMNGILGTTQLLRETALEPDQRELVDLMQQSAECLLSLINDVLDFSKIAADRLELDRAPFDLRDCVRAVTRLQSSAALQKGVELTAEIDESLPRTVVGDSMRLRQVLLNLTDNAVKFTEEGSIRITVESVEGQPYLVRFAVTDTGVGVAPEAQVRIFEPFTQADTSTSRAYGGTGLGLAISGRLVDLMEGELELRSESGEGSSFFFTLPLPAVPSGLRTDGEREDPIESHVGAGLSVLVVDDNEVNLTIAVRMLESLGCRVRSARDGREALDIVQAGQFDVVFMDCAMPTMDGYEATAAIRRLQNETAVVPIIAMTANTMPSERARCLEAGMDDYLPKPVELRLLRRKLRAL